MTSVFLGISYLTLHNRVCLHLLTNFIFFVTAEKYFICICHYPSKSVERHLVCFLFLLIVHRTVVNMVERVSVEYDVQSLGICRSRTWVI